MDAPSDSRIESSEKAFMFKEHERFDSNTYQQNYEIRVENGRFSSNSNELSRVAIEEVQSITDFNAKYRSVGYADSSSLSGFGPSGGFESFGVKPPSLNRNFASPHDDHFLSVTELSLLSQQTKPAPSPFSGPKVVAVPAEICVPNKPHCLLPNHFLCTLSILDLVSKVNQILRMMLEVNFQFTESSCEWVASCKRGASICDFEFHVYKEGESSYLIEGNRIEGDGFMFRNIFNEIKSGLASSTSESGLDDRQSMMLPSSDSFSMGSGVTIPTTDPLPDADALEGIRMIVEMVKSPSIETKQEAASILCDLSFQEEMQQVLSQAEFVHPLVELLALDKECGNCSYYAVCALANLSAQQSCQELLCGSPKLLLTLLKLAQDGCYQTTETRREATRTLANLCQRHSTKVVGIVGNSHISSWISNVNYIKDDRLRTHATRAKYSLESCSAVF